MTPRLSIAREAVISIVINAVLSLAFFLAFFGVAPRLLQWGAPDNLALDFVPQSIAVSLMSALVPALIARKKLGGGLPVLPILLRAALFAVAGGVLGGVMAFAVVALGLPAIGWSAALPVKMIYGGALGALVAVLALRRLQASLPASR
jgi:hypothetical protein